MNESWEGILEEGLENPRRIRDGFSYNNPGKNLKVIPGEIHKGIPGGINDEILGEFLIEYRKIYLKELL